MHEDRKHSEQTRHPEVVLEIARLDGDVLRIRHAVEMAQVFFRLDPSAHGPKAYDTLIRSSKPDRIETSDISAINATMAARTPLYRWQDLIALDRPAWLMELDPSWALFELTDGDWTARHVESKIASALAAMIAPGRRLSVVTKVLHMKRPALIPVCDRLVLEQLGAPANVDHDPAAAAAFIGHVRCEGRRNIDGLRAVQERLAAEGRSLPLVRIFEALVWQSHPEVWYHKLAALVDEWLDGEPHTSDAATG